MKISIFTSMTNPEERNDPWKEALDCYENFADEVIVVGKDWPHEFSFDYIGKTFQEGFEKCTGDWVFWMDLDNFFHEKSFMGIKNLLLENSAKQGINFRKFQIFTPDRFHAYTDFCIAVNKRKFPEISFSGGGDLCQPNIKNELITNMNIPRSKFPLYNYDSVFKTKKIISDDRARFARAWYRQFGDYGNRGGETSEKAYNAWFNNIEERYKKHVTKITLDNHPVFIKDKLRNLEHDQFGYDLFGLKKSVKRSPVDYFKGYKDYTSFKTLT